MAEKKNLYSFKITVVGEGRVGKTSLIQKFTNNSFNEDYLKTLGASFSVYKSSINNDAIKLIIWDIAGQVQWDILRGAYYRGSHGVCVVGDLSSKRTFQKIEKFWIKDARENCNESIPVILLANKNDLKAEISEEEVKELANRCNVKRVIFTSAKTSYHVEEAFIGLIKMCLDTDPLIFVGYN